MREAHPFDGAKLAASNPDIIWGGPYDASMYAPAVQVREHQREFLRVFMGYIRDGGDFLLEGVAPPGSGKSVLAASLCRIVAQAAPGTKVYICAGQGRQGMSQFMGGLYGEMVHFAMSYMEGGRRKSVEQHSQGAPRKGRRSRALEKEAVCSVFVGTPDAIASHLECHEGRPPILIIDEVDYGSFEAGRTCREIMALLVGNRRTVVFSATLAPAEHLAVIHQWYGRTHRVQGSADSIQIPTDVRTLEGRAVLLHLGCETAAAIRAVARKARYPPFSRAYSIGTLTFLCATMRALGAVGVPDLRDVFDSAENLSPAIVLDTAIRVLQVLAAQTTDVIVAVCRRAPPDVEPINYAELGTRGAFPHQAMVVSHDPESVFAAGMSALFKELRAAGVPAAAALYEAYERRTAALAREADLREKRPTRDEDKEDDRGDSVGGAQFGFPDWAQIGTAPHQRRFQSCRAPDGGRVGVSATTVPRCVVTDDLQTGALCGAAVYSGPVGNNDYQRWVERVVSAGDVGVFYTATSGCYGLNSPVQTVAMADPWAPMSLVIQAWGRLCRGKGARGYSGTFYIPDSIARALLAAAQTGEADVPVSAEAANMSALFAEAVARQAGRGRT
jgi:hypothetical protein